jgi:hypothetical protein
MKNLHFLPLATATAAGLVVLLATCVGPPRMPALDGAVIEIRRSDQALPAGARGPSNELQLYWFGSACHLIRLGEVSVLTDPFVTNNLEAFGLVSDPARVAATLGRIEPPDDVVVNGNTSPASGPNTSSSPTSIPSSRKIPMNGWLLAPSTS